MDIQTNREGWSGWQTGEREELTGGWMDGYSYRKLSGWMSEVEGRMDAWADGRMDGWMWEGRTNGGIEGS